MPSNVLSRLRNAYPVFLLWLAAAACAAATPDAITVDGGRYYGPLVDGKLHGRGRVEWASGAVYEGEFREGLMSGEGELRQRGRVYRGEFVRGAFNGKGRFEDPNGDIYEGDFSRGDFTGSGRFARKDGSRYEGEFRDWRFQGRGRFTDPSGNVWEGTFVNGQLEGPGRASSQHGTYEGEFKGWRFHGKGRLKLANGDLYEGGFQDGLYEGQGTLTYGKPRPDGRKEETGVWRYGMLGRDAERKQARSDVEVALYAQKQLLDQALASLKPREPGRINLYLLAVAGDGSQEVFRREVEFVQAEFARRFGTAGRTVALVNSRSTVASAPMATLTSIREALRAIAARMDREQDILFLFLTSHGSADHELSLAQNGIDLQDLPAGELGAMLKESGIRWKVVVVSACYSGGFIEPLQDERSLIITAARRDRRSFGCADENDFTYFGRAFFKESLPKSRSFVEAFRSAEALVRDWERRDAGDAGAAGSAGAKLVEENQSLPQVSNASAIDTHLKRWWSQSTR